MNRFTLRLSAVSAAFGLALLLPAVASAMVAPMTLQQLVDSSSAIVRVKVVGESARAVGEGGRRIPMDSIVTDSQLRIVRAYKGSKPSRFTLTQTGGSAEGYRLEVSDVPELRIGDEVVLFLDGSRVVGGEQGALTVMNGQVPQLGVSLSELEGAVRAARNDTLSPDDDPATAMRERAAALTVAPTSEAAGAVASRGLTIAATPAVANVFPAGANGGVGEKVTITGSGFGTTPGHVYFLKGSFVGDENLIPNWSDGRYVEEATIDSWTDSAISIVVPGNAQSGTIAVYAANGSSVKTQYTMGFSYLGSKWAEKAVSYYINENTRDMVGEGAVIQRAMSTWSTCGADFAMVRAGESTASGMPQADNKNDIYFVTDDLSNTPFEDYLAINSLWYDTDSQGHPGKFIESNLMFFDYQWRWGDGNTDGALDLETVALHELGHTVGLGDQYMSTDRVMGAYDGNLRRSLSAYEVSGAVAIYGSSRLGLASSAKLTPSYGKPAYVSVRLRDNFGQPIVGQVVTLNRDQTPVATLVGSLSDPGLYYGYAPVVKSKTTFWAHWAGDGTNSAGVVLVTVRPKVKLSANAPESNRRYRKFTVKGTIAPAHSKAKVHFEVWKRRSSGGYYRYKTYSVTTSKGSFSKSISLPKGRFRVRTTHSDTGHASSASSYDYFSVR